MFTNLLSHSTVHQRGHNGVYIHRGNASINSNTPLSATIPAESAGLNLSHIIPLNDSLNASINSYVPHNYSTLHHNNCFNNLLIPLQNDAALSSPLQSQYRLIDQSYHFYNTLYSRFSLFQHRNRQKEQDLRRRLFPQPVSTYPCEHLDGAITTEIPPLSHNIPTSRAEFLLNTITEQLSDSLRVFRANLQDFTHATNYPQPLSFHNHTSSTTPLPTPLSLHSLTEPLTTMQSLCQKAISPLIRPSNIPLPLSSSLISQSLYSPLDTDVTPYDPDIATEHMDAISALLFSPRPEETEQKSFILPKLNRIDSNYLDMPSFLILSGIGLLCVRVVLYPLNVIKTRLQATTPVPSGINPMISALKEESQSLSAASHPPTIVPPIPVVQAVSNASTVAASVASTTLPTAGIATAAATTTTNLGKALMEKFSFGNLFVGKKSLQTPSHIKNQRASQVFIDILRHEGVRPLFAGLGLSLILTVSRQLYFFMYEHLRSAIIHINNEFNVIESEATFNSVKDSIAAFAATALYQLIANPLDIIVQRLMTHNRAVEKVSHLPSSAANNANAIADAFDPFAVQQAPRPKSTQLQYIVDRFSAIRLTRNLWHNDPTVFYRGFVSSTILWSLNSCIWWGTFEALLQKFTRYFPESSFEKSQTGHFLDSFLDHKESRELLHNHSWYAQHLAAAISSWLSVVLTHPLDTSRTKLMVQCSKGDGMTALSTIRRIIRDEGHKGLWTGMGARIMLVVPSSVCTMYIYQISKVLSVEWKLTHDIDSIIEQSTKDYELAKKKTLAAENNDVMEDIAKPMNIMQLGEIEQQKKQFFDQFINLPQNLMTRLKNRQQLVSNDMNDKTALENMKQQQQQQQQQQQDEFLSKQKFYQQQPSFSLRFVPMLQEFKKKTANVTGDDYIYGKETRQQEPQYHHLHPHNLHQSSQYDYEEQILSPQETASPQQSVPVQSKQQSYWSSAYNYIMSFFVSNPASSTPTSPVSTELISTQHVSFPIISNDIQNVDSCGICNVIPCECCFHDHQYHHHHHGYTPQNPHLAKTREELFLMMTQIQDIAQILGYDVQLELKMPNEQFQHLPPAQQQHGDSSNKSATKHSSHNNEGDESDQN